MTDTILTNARIVLADEVIRGTVVIRGETFLEISETRSALPAALDMDGDTLIPGIVDVHTDNLERQVQPRSNARWPSRSAMMVHDAQCAACGVTTVLDALCLGDLGFEKNRIQTFREGVIDLDALAQTGLLKSEHFLHLRCEMPAPDVMELVEPVAEHPRVRMVSLMDHSPGVGQYASLDSYRGLRRREGMTEDVIEQRIVELVGLRGEWRDRNRGALLDLIRPLGLPMASHDDRTEDEIRENCADGIRISEFPVTMAAARAARAAGMQVIAGAPNIVRGGSHSGNVNAADLVRAEVVDALASDYVPASLVEAAFLCAAMDGISLPEAVALVTDRPAQMCELRDRGRIAAGMRADLVRVRPLADLPVVRMVWRTGERVA